MHTNSATLIREAAADFIGRQHSSKPFFLYLPFQNIHAPYTCDAIYRGRYEDRPERFTADEMTMFGYISELDDAVGNVVSAMKTAGRYESSLVVFSRYARARALWPSVCKWRSPPPPSVVNQRPFSLAQ